MFVHREWVVFVMSFHVLLHLLPLFLQMLGHLLVDVFEKLHGAWLLLLLGFLKFLHDFFASGLSTFVKVLSNNKIISEC